MFLAKVAVISECVPTFLSHAPYVTCIRVLNMWVAVWRMGRRRPVSSVVSWASASPSYTAELLGRAARGVRVKLEKQGQVM